MQLYSEVIFYAGLNLFGQHFYFPAGGSAKIDQYQRLLIMHTCIESTKTFPAALFLTSSLFY